VSRHIPPFSSLMPTTMVVVYALWTQETGCYVGVLLYSDYDGRGGHCQLFQVML